MSRVALLCPYALSVPGGVQEQALAMSRELGRRGHEVLLVAPDARDDSSPDTPARVVRLGAVARIPANGSIAPLTLSLRAAGAARREVAGFDPDVVHLHEPFAPVLGYGVVRAHAAPSVATFHRSGGGPAVSLFAPALRRFARRLDATAAVSHAAADTARAYGVTPTVLFNGFEVERFSEFERERHDGVTILFIGRLEARKGAAVAVDAVLGHGRPDWRLVIAGDGPERAAILRRAAGDARVTLLGAVSDADKRRWLRRADVAVAPALSGESFGLVVLEAMASGTPVVVSDIDGYREAAGDAGVLVTPGDAVSLSHGIAQALVQHESRAAAGLEHAAGWSMRSLVDRYEAVYASAAEAFTRRR